MTYKRFVSVLSLVAFAVVAMGVAPVWASSDDTAENNVTASVDEQLKIAPTGSPGSATVSGDATGANLGTSALGSAAATGTGEDGDLSFGIDFSQSTGESATVDVPDQFEARGNVAFDVTVEPTNTSTGEFNYDGTNTPSTAKPVSDLTISVTNSATWGGAVSSPSTMSSSSPVDIVSSQDAGEYGTSDATNGADVKYEMSNTTSESMTPGNYGVDVLWTITSSS